MANQDFDILLADRRRGFPRQFRFVTYGDSKSRLMGGLHSQNSSLRLAMLMWPIDYRIDPSLDNTGVDGRTVATSASNLANDAVMAPMLARFAAGQNVLIFKGFTNDSGNSVATDMAAFQKIVTKARLAGCKLFIVMGLNPYAPNDATSARKFESIDQALRQYERLNDDVWYVPSTLALLDLTSATRQPLTDTMGVDGIHESALGAYLEAQVLAREFQRRSVPRRHLATISPADKPYGPYNGDPQSPVGNFLGPLGTFTTTGNSAGMDVTNSGSGSITGAANWVGGDAGDAYCRLSGALNGTVSLAITTEACAYINEQGFRTDATRPRLSLSGTPSADFSLKVELYRNVYSADGANYALPVNIYTESEFAWQANSLKGVAQIRGPGSFGAGTTGTIPYPAMTGTMLDLSYAPALAAGNPSFGVYDFTLSLQWDFASGVALDGSSIDLIGAGVRQLYPLQAAAA